MVMVRRKNYYTCEYHRGVDAVGVCTRCDRLVCSTCYTKFRKRTYCKNCYEELFTGENKPSEKPTIGGILGIISGVTAVSFVGPILFHFIFRALGYDGLWATSGSYDTNSIWYGSVIKGAWIPLGVFTIGFSKCALDRSNYWMAVAGGVLAAVVMPPLGIPALILIAKSKKEFKNADTYLSSLH